MDNNSIHHVGAITTVIEGQHGAKLCYLSPYSPDLTSVEGVFSQIKSIMKENYKLFQVCSAPAALLAFAFGMVSV
jgi:transposase